MPNAENDAPREHVERITSELLLTDALTGNDEGTPTHYTVHADDVEYLVRTVLDLAAQVHEERVAELARVLPPAKRRLPMDKIETAMWQALGRAMRAKDDALALALFNEYRDYQHNFKETA